MGRRWLLDSLGPIIHAPHAGRRPATAARLVVAAACAFALGFVLSTTTQFQTTTHSPALEATKLSTKRRIALLHKAHGVITMRGLQFALLAQQQVLSAGGWYGLLYSTHPEPTPGHHITLEVLRHTLGQDSVFTVGTADVAAALGGPLLEEQRRILSEREWAWVTNDVVDITWFVTSGEAVLPAWAQHLWLLELDVGWTGDLVGTLLSVVGTHNNGSSSNADGPSIRGDGGSSTITSERQQKQEPDWVAYNTQKADAGWRWFAARNRLDDSHVWRSYRHAARCSRRLLHAVAAAMRSGHVQSDEAMGPSVCAAHSAAWCLLDTSWQPGHHTIGRDAATGESLYRWELAIGPERWEAIVTADACGAGRGNSSSSSSNRSGAEMASSGECGPGQLYHALKW